MNNPNDTRRLAPDTKWILTTVGAVALGIVGINQYQLGTLEKTHLRAIDQLRAEDIERKQYFEKRLSRVDRDITGLREARAQQTEQGQNIRESLTRLVDVAVTTQQQTARADGRIEELVNQTRTNTEIIANMVQTQNKISQTLSERLTALEARTHGGVQAPR